MFFFFLVKCKIFELGETKFLPVNMKFFDIGLKVMLQSIYPGLVGLQALFTAPLGTGAL